MGYCGSFFNKAHSYLNKWILLLYESLTVTDTGIYSLLSYVYITCYNPFHHNLTNISYTEDITNFITNYIKYLWYE